MLRTLFTIGPLGRLTRVLQLYNFKWLDVKDKAKASFHKDAFARLDNAYVTWVKDKLKDTNGIPDEHKQELLGHMGTPSGDTQEAANTDFPLYLYIEGDLPRAGIWARMPYLRMQLRGKEHRRAKCAWCRRPQQEYGHHLIRCPSMPPRLRRRRDAVLAAIDQEV